MLFSTSSNIPGTSHDRTTTPLRYRPPCTHRAAAAPRYPRMIAFLDTRTWWWRLDAAQLQSHLSSERLDFTTIPARQQRTAKELFAALLSGPLPLGEYRLAMGTVTALFPQVKRFLIWADGTCPRISLAALSPEMLGNYALFLLADVPDTGHRENARRAVRMLWRYRSALTEPLNFDPQYAAEGWSQQSRSRAENITPRIPEQVLGPLIAWSLRFVDDFAPDILTALEHSGPIKNRTKPSALGRNSGAHAALTEVLDPLHPNWTTPTRYEARSEPITPSPRRPASATSEDLNSGNRSPLPKSWSASIRTHGFL